MRKKLIKIGEKYFVEFNKRDIELYGLIDGDYIELEDMIIGKKVYNEKRNKRSENKIIK